MANKKNMSVSSMLLGSLVGGVLGATVGLLFAPKPGESLRKDIKSQTKKATHKANELKDTAQEKSNQLSNKAMAKKSELQAKKRYKKLLQKEFNTTSFVTGSEVCGVLGASVGLLVAPKPGNDLRRDVNLRSKQALETVGDWKDDMQDSDSKFKDLAITTKNELKNKSANATKKALIKATELKEVVQGNDPETLERILNKGTKYINMCIDAAKYIINKIDEFSKTAENLTEFTQDATDQTKELYEDVSEKAKSLKEEVVETTTEVKDEIVDYTKEVTHEAEDLKDETIETTKKL